MPIRIVNFEFNNKPVKTELVISAIETNRDRVRTTCNMLITTSGILVPVCLAFLLFFIEKGFLNTYAVTVMALAILSLLISTSISIVSSFLRNRYVITDEGQYIEGLIILLNLEIRISRLAFVFLLVGMVTMVISVTLVILSL